jgi:hypothetical protein
MSYVETYKEYTIREGRTAGGSIGYTITAPDGKQLGLVQSSIAEAKWRIDNAIAGEDNYC